MTISETPTTSVHADASQRVCVHCKNAMRRIGLAAHYQRSVEIDVCEECSLIWFDETESARIAGPGIVDLIRVIHGAMQRPRPMQPLPNSLPCPVCDAPLKRVHNMSRFGRTSQLECPVKHGAFQSFALFLAEKGYFHPFTWADIKKLMEAGKKPHCFNCGAQLESRPHDECPYCRSPVGLIDPARLAQAIDIHHAAPTLQLAPTVNQASCPACGGAVDLSLHMACPHCLAVLRPTDTQGAAAAGNELDAEVRRNYENQSIAVSRAKLAELGSFDDTAYKQPRTENIRRSVIGLLVMAMIGYAVARGLMHKSSKSIYEQDANGNMVGYTAAEYSAKEKARRQSEMGSTRHAPPGEAPAELEVSQNGDRLVITSRVNKTLWVTVNLAYEQYSEFWQRCKMVNMNDPMRREMMALTKIGDSKTLTPQSCKPKILEKGRYEYTVWETTSGKPVFKSDSAFFD